LLNGIALGRHDRRVHEAVALVVGDQPDAPAAGRQVLGEAQHGRGLARAQEPSHHDVVSAHSSLVVSIPGTSMTARQHPVYRRVENRYVSVDVNRIRSRLTLKFIQPAFSIGIRFGEGDILSEKDALTQKTAGPGGEYARDGFQPLDRADLVADR